MDAALREVVASLEATTKAVDAIDVEREPTALVQQLMSKAGMAGELEGVSLLLLKNGAMLGYLDALARVVAVQVERASTNEDTWEEWSQTVEASVVHRVTLERGVKGLEKRLAYQLDKIGRAYTRAEEEVQKVEQKAAAAGEDEEESDSDSDDAALAFKPDAQALASTMKETARDTSGTYKPPRIAAAAAPDSGKAEKPRRQLQLMEEYLAESGDAPLTESSIGSTIVGHGRGGVKTSRDKQREAEIQRYEEDNFTRLPTTMTKKLAQQKRKEARNTFAGEDWSMFNNNRSVAEGTLRKRKGGSAWDRAKRRG